MTTLRYHAILALLCAAPIAAQFQAANETARRLGLVVREVESGPQQPDLFAPQGDLGQNAIVLMELALATDNAFDASSLGLSLPTCITPGGIWADITGGVPAGTLPAGTLLRFQAFAIDPLTVAFGVAVSNGVTRIVQNPFTRPINTPPYGLSNPNVAAADYLEVEQADVDGDGDLETLLIGCNGTIRLYETVDGVLSTQTPIYQLQTARATSAEFADFNNDNYVDLVIGLVPPFGVGVGNPPQRSVAILMNNGRAPAGPNLVLGPWQSFTVLPANVITWDPNIRISTPPFSSEVAITADVETADIDGDGFIDILVGAASFTSSQGQQNRLLRNQGTDQTLFTEVTATSLNTLIKDDTEDVEFADLDDDGDWDFVVGNFDGPSAIVGQDFVYVNQGGMQGGTEGSFNFQTIINPAPDDETWDVLAADLNEDGLLDIYVGNWYATQGNQGIPNWVLDPVTGYGVVRFDRLYLQNQPGPNGALSWSDASNLLPDNPNYIGPFPVDPWATSDAEVADANRDGILEILVSAGTRCGTSTPPHDPSTPPPHRGLHLLRRLGPWYFDDSSARGGGILPAPLLPTQVDGLDINDMETGDWQRIFWDLDAGMATAMTAGPPASQGLMLLLR